MYPVVKVIMRKTLANKLGIATSGEIDEAELVLLEHLSQFVFEEQFPEG